MPIVEVKMWEGRSAEDKDRLIAAISGAFEDALGVQSEHLHIVITDVPKENWGSRGKSAIHW